MNRHSFASGFVALAAFLGLLGLTTALDAQQPAPRRIGVLLVGPSLDSKEAQAFQQGLRDAGYAEGRDVVIEWRSAAGDYARIPALAAELVQSKVDVIVVNGTPATRAAKHATSTIPIVMVLVADPVGSGLVANLAHPGENITGGSMMAIELIAKRLQLLKETIPRLTRVAVIGNPDNPLQPKVVEDLKAAAPSLVIELKFVSVRTPEQFDPAFSALSQTPAQALYVIGDPFFLPIERHFSNWSPRPGCRASMQRNFVDEGGLMSYGPNLADEFRRSAGYVDKILKGAKPGDLPIEQPTKFELVVNLKTAKALGITIPESILLQADEVIR